MALNLLFVVLIALATYTLGPLVLGIELGTLPGLDGVRVGTLVVAEERSQFYVACFYV